MPSPYDQAVTNWPALVATIFLGITFVLSCVRISYAPPYSRPPPPPPSPNGQQRIAPLPDHLHNRLTLPSPVCEQEFPLLYPQLHDLRRHWSSGISLSDVDRLEAAAKSQDRWGWARVLVRDGRLWIRTLFPSPDTRLAALLSQLNDAVLSSPEPLPPLDLVISSGDKDGFPGAESGPSWVLTKLINNSQAKGNFLAPDFGFKGWPEAQAPTYPEVVALQKQVEQQYPWDRKDDRAFWRGFPNMYPIRKDLMDRTRPSSHLSPTSSDAWSDVFATTFGGETGPEFRPLVKLQDHCQRKYLIHSEGNSYSGRSKYLLSCHAITIAHKMEWTQHFHPALISSPTSPSQNFIELPGPGFDGLEETVRALWASDHDPKSSAASSQGYLDKARNKYHTVDTLPARQIADNARDSLRDRYLTSAATMCYYRAALKVYGDLLKFDPKVHEGNGAAPGKMLGTSKDAKGDISYDSWIVIGAKGDWPPK